MKKIFGWNFALLFSVTLVVAFGHRNTIFATPGLWTSYFRSALEYLVFGLSVAFAMGFTASLTATALDSLWETQ